MRKLLRVMLCAVLAAATACAPANPPEDPVPAEITGQAHGMPDPERMQAAFGSLQVTPEAYPNVDGSTSTLPIVQLLWTAVHGTDHGEGLPKEAAKTVPAYHLLIDGAADMIIVPAPSETVLETAREKGVTLAFHKVAAEALIFITPAENPAQDITENQLRDIYLRNTIKNWKEIGGPNKKLIPIARNADSGSQSQMDNLILKNEPMNVDIQENHVELTMEGMLEQVAYYHTGGLSEKATDSYALGYTLYTYLQNTNSITGIGDQLKILNYDGVPANKETISDGTYPLAEGYYAVVRTDLPADHSARTMIAWLQSEDGQYLIQTKGYIPATAPMFTE